MIPHFDEPGAKQKIGSAAVDLILEPANIVTTIDDAKSVAEGVTGLGRVEEGTLSGTKPTGKNSTNIGTDTEIASKKAPEGK